MRSAAFIEACGIITKLRNESQHWRKLLYQVSDEQSVANKALTDIAKCCGLKSWTIPQLVESVSLALAEREERDLIKKEIKLMASGCIKSAEMAGEEVERLQEQLYAARQDRDNAQREVESLRAKLASRTVEWPEWAKEGTRVRVRSTRNAVTQRNFADGEEFVIEKVYYTDWAVRSPRQYWAHLSDLEPVAEHVAPPSLQVGDTVRLVRTPKTFAGSHWCNEWGQAGDHGKVLTYKNTDEVLVSCKAGADRAYWPVSCVEVVK